MKSENLLVSISFVLLIFTNAYLESFALSTTIYTILNITAITLSITALISQFRKKFTRKCAVLNK